MELITTDDKKVCPKCRQEKLLCEFFRDRTKSQGRAAYCKGCVRSYQREWEKKNPEKRREISKRYRERYPDRITETQRRCYSKPERKQKQRKWQRQNKDKVRIYQMKSKFGLTTEQAVELSKIDKCSACGGPPGKHNLHVDHNHRTGEVRGMLCHGCNVSLGLLREDLERIRALANYIERGRRVNDHIGEP